MSKYLYRFSILGVVAFALSACGYKPVSHATRSFITQPLYLEVELSKKEPDSAIFLRDELYHLIRYRLGVRLSSLDSSKSRLNVSYGDITYAALGYDTNGYVRRYRVHMSAKYRLDTAGKFIDRTINTSYEANVTPSAIESSRAKRLAIQECAKKSIDQFVAYIASRSMKAGER